MWTYPNHGGARRWERRLSDGTLGDLAVTDGVLVTWVHGRESAHVRELEGVARTCSLGTAFWGMLFGIIVSGPTLTSLAGSLPHALDDSLEAVGMDRKFLAALRGRMRPGGSAVAAVCPEPTASAITSASRMLDSAAFPLARGSPAQHRATAHRDPGAGAETSLRGVRRAPRAPVLY